MRKFYVLAIVLSFTGCVAGRIDSVTLNPPDQWTSPDHYLETHSSLGFTVDGQGTCGELTVDYGDDSSDHLTSRGFRFYPLHQYVGWGGGKTVTVIPGANCSGFARTRFNIEPTRTRTFAWARDRRGNINICNAVPNAPPLASNSLVHVTGQPTPVVNFGCPFNKCIADAEGRPGTIASSAFPFPGMREYSLVLRVGTQPPFQGGINTQFVVPIGGTLEACQNTDNPAAATGGWELGFTVDQLGRP
jgi:hypothetical protein